MSVPELYRGGESDGRSLAARPVYGPVLGYDARVDTHYLRGFDPWVFQTGSAVLALLLDAQEMLSRARSYRDFRVAVAAHAIGPDMIGRRVGYNIKRSADDMYDVHAEEMMVEKATEAGFVHIPTIVLVGEPQIDQTSGRRAETLFTCERRCTPCLLASLLIDNERTLVVMARPDFTVIQWGSMNAIAEFHKTGDPSGITTVRFQETPAILRPGRWDGQREDGTVAPEEIDSTDYDLQVTARLAAWSMQLGL